MRGLIKEVRNVGDDVKINVDKRLKEFSSFSRKNEESWFSELCFCILTANSKSSTACAIQDELGFNGFMTFKYEEIRDSILVNKHRFHNTKALRIVEARKHFGVKKKVKDLVSKGGAVEAREYLVKNVKGYGYKEASHFLRNVGYFDVAILDRHIVNLMVEHGLLEEFPKSWNKAKYVKAEEAFKKIAKKAKMTCGELDMYMWYLKAGTVGK